MLSRFKNEGRSLEDLSPSSWPQTFRKDSFTAALAGVYTGVMGPFLGLVAAKTLHAPVFLLSLMMAAPFIGNMLTPLWVHHLHGRPKLPFVVVPALVARSLYLLMALVHTASQFVLLVFAAQIFEASSGPGYSAVMERVYPQSLRGRLMSYVRVARTIVVIGITLAVGHVLDRWGFRQVFAAAAALGIAASAIFATIRVPGDLDEVEKTQPRASPGAAWRIFREDRDYRRFALAVFVYGTGNLILGPIYPLFLDRTLHITYVQQGLLAFAGSLAAVVGFLFWGHYIDRFGPVRCVFACIAVVALKPFLYYIARDSMWLVPAAVLDGISGSGIEVGYINSILSFSPAALVPSYQSLHASLLGIRGVISPFVAGILVTVLQAHHLGLRPAFLISGCMILVGFWMGRGVRVPEGEHLKRHPHPSPRAVAAG